MAESSVVLPPETGSLSMSEYRIFAIGPDGRFAGEPKIVECIDDQEAIHKASQFIDGRDLEVWTPTRLIARLPKSST